METYDEIYEKIQSIDCEEFEEFEWIDLRILIEGKITELEERD